ncbi:hypothetical protein PV963_29575 [Streptomyces coeruleorubidus]|uniref:hypothetical protein n=1 Tax=Streptomyces coeruleorubidus TaxID=116188 RepID=UPI00237F9B58|nr:hypothetical protein [Streptomyces coeruleorubidus]WDV54212.1 hypothetical protein PV963_29575 [Streptomyces coeruleorubidus]
MTAGALTAAVTLSLTATATADVGDEDVVRVKFTGITAIDTQERWLDPGDSWVSYLTLYTPKKKFAGDASSRCTAVEANGKRLTAQCTRVLRLKDGEITLHDMITREGGKPVTAKTAIAGGTGIYNDAEGEGYITLEGGRVHFDLYIDD